MRAAIRFACCCLLTTGLVSALPFDVANARQNDARPQVKPRAYAVVNVDGSSNADAAAQLDTGHREDDVQRRSPDKSYSVVNVDGGPTSTTAAQLPPVTFTQTVVQSATPSTEVVVTVSTQVYTQDTTLVVTETQVPEPSVTQTVVYTTTILAAPSSPSVTSTEATSTTPSPAPTSTITAGNTTFIMPSLTSSPVISVSLVTLPPSVVTVTATESDTISYYDNGMWHTSYAIKTWATVSPA